jgi:hypothetical protein
MHRIVDALKWACGAAALAFTVLFLTPLVIGGPGAHQAPVLAFLLTPIIFVATLIFTLVWSRLGLIVIAASLLYRRGTTSTCQRGSGKPHSCRSTLKSRLWYDPGTSRRGLLSMEAGFLRSIERTSSRTLAGPDCSPQWALWKTRLRPI